MGIINLAWSQEARTASLETRRSKMVVSDKSKPKLKKAIDAASEAIDKAGLLVTTPIRIESGTSPRGTGAIYHMGHAFSNAPSTSPRILIDERYPQGMMKEYAIHEYGHHVDWVKGGEKILKPSEIKTNPPMWSATNLDKWYPGISRHDAHEMFAESFHHYVKNGTTKGVPYTPAAKFISGSTKEAFHNWLDNNLKV